MGVQIRGDGLIVASAADGAGVVGVALSGVGGGNGDHAAVPDVLTRGITGDEGLGTDRAADAAVVVLSAAGTVGGSGQVGIAHHLLIEHVGVSVGGDGLVHSGIADGAGIPHNALGGVAGSLEHRAAVPAVLRVGRFGGSLGRRFRGGLGDGLTRDKLIEDGTTVVIDQGIGILGNGGGGGIHAHQTGSYTLGEPARAIHIRKGIGQIVGDLSAHAAVDHQGAQTEGSAGVADGGTELHIAAGGCHSIGGDVAHQDVAGEAGNYRYFYHGHISPLGIRLAGAVQGAVHRGVYRLGGADIHDQRLAAAGKIGVIGMGTAVIGGAVQGILIGTPASGEILDVIKEFLRQREIPCNRLPVCLVLGGVAVQRQNPQNQDRAEQQGQCFLKNSLSHRAQLLSHAAASRHWYLHYTYFFELCNGVFPGLFRQKWKKFLIFMKNPTGNISFERDNIL